jgi:hypothetical protein
MLRKSMSAIFVSSLLVTGVAFGDTLIMDGVQPQEDGQYPAKGSAKSSVIESLGEPTSQAQPVGDPPITSWDYGSFVVYFEYDRVLHTVAKR